MKKYLIQNNTTKTHKYTVAVSKSFLFYVARGKTVFDSVAGAKRRLWLLNISIHPFMCQYVTGR